MGRPPRDLKIVIAERQGGYTPQRLLMALNMLISEKDFIDYFGQQNLESKSQSATSSRPRGNTGSGPTIRNLEQRNVNP
jgi:hypothetical protein